ncbi:MAG: hypothetical protein AB1665_04605 [Candidatus Thermoplasmatota archaeon]
MARKDASEQSSTHPSLRFSGWIECRHCRALMYGSFKRCWSCGAETNGARSVSL